METNKESKSNPPKRSVSSAVSCSTPMLFECMERENRETRSAAMKEAAQRVRQEKRKAVAYLRERGKEIEPTIDLLLDNGPMTEIALMLSEMKNTKQEVLRRAEISAFAFTDLWALWRVGKLWRKSQGIHMGTGEEFFLYGIRKVHFP